MAGRGASVDPLRRLSCVVACTRAKRRARSGWLVRMGACVRPSRRRTLARHHCCRRAVPCSPRRHSATGFIAARSHQWAIADRVAWGELPADRFEQVGHLPRLLAALRPVDAPSQLVHSDLTGNVLFAEGFPPAIIDLSLYWRPPAYASAIVVADALVWEGAGEDLLETIAHVEAWEQFLLRA